MGELDALRRKSEPADRNKSPTPKCPFWITCEIVTLRPSVFRLNLPWGCQGLGSPCGVTEHLALTGCDAVSLSHVPPTFASHLKT